MLAEHALRRKQAEHAKIEKTLANINTAYENNKAIIDNQDEGLKSLNATLNKTEDGAKEVEKLMGLSGAAVGSLEAALIQLIESSCTISLHCGCTSTLLLILAFFKQNSINCKPQVILAPNYEAVIKAKVAQSESFYKIISDLFSSDFTFTILQEPLIKKPRK
jgi:hypothetical protein